MARGLKKHLKRLNAPKNWMLDKLGGIFAPRPRPGPYKHKECLPLILIIRNRLKYALTTREVMMILKQRFIKVNGKVRTDHKFAIGFMDVITIAKTGDKFRLLYDTKGRFVLHKIKEAETHYKLCKVEKRLIGKKKTPIITTTDGRTIRFPDPNLKRNDTVVVDVNTGKIKEWVRCKPGVMAIVTGGSNVGRIGELLSIERHPGSFDLVHLKDAADNQICTRLTNVFVIGSSIYNPLVSLPKMKGVRLSTVEDRERKLAKNAKKKAEKAKPKVRKPKVAPKKAKGKKGKANPKKSKKGGKKSKPKAKKSTKPKPKPKKE